MNGFRTSPGWLFGFMDSLLIFGGVLSGTLLRFRGDVGFIYQSDYFVLKVMLIVLVFQVVFYYFDLYDSKSFIERKRMGVIFLGAIGVSTIILAVIYYIIPFLTLGRGIIAISLFFILIFTYSWRVFYSYTLKAWVSKERILIIGTGELAKKIKKEILDNGYEGFEIVGFIDDDRDKIGRSV